MMNSPRDPPDEAGMAAVMNGKTCLDRYFAHGAIFYGPDVELSEGIELSRESLQYLAGCPKGGSVTVSADHQGIHLKSCHPRYIKNRRNDANYVHIRVDGAHTYLYLDYIWFADTCPKGFGVVAVLRMAAEAKRLGFSYITLLAAGGSGIKGSPWNEKFWGYQIWPRLGFDTELQSEILALIKDVEHLRHCKRVSDIIQKDLDWWMSFGDGWEMHFDLTDGSASWDTFYNFISERGLIL